jgi:hypothetical protein
MEKGAMILTSNRGFAEWGEVFGDPAHGKAITPCRLGQEPANRRAMVRDGRERGGLSRLRRICGSGSPTTPSIPARSAPALALEEAP